MKKALRIAVVVLFFLAWLGWCFGDYISGALYRLTTDPEITALTIILVLVMLIIGAGLAIVAFGAFLALTLIIGKIVLHVIGFHDDAKAVDNLYSSGNATAFCTCLIILIMLIITLVTKTEVMTWALSCLA